MKTEAEKDTQLSLWGDDEPDEEGVTLKNTEVDIPFLCEKFKRLGIARDIAEANKFMHWELEFAEIFAERGGFDLTIGIIWNSKVIMITRFSLDFHICSLSYLHSNVKVVCVYFNLDIRM